MHNFELEGPTHNLELGGPKALRKEFPNYEVYFFEIHKAMAKYYSEKQKDMSNDSTSLYEELIRRKNENP
ncbi:9065_t:CDS:2, partial [Racocetra fulgida]